MRVSDAITGLLCLALGVAMAVQARAFLGFLPAAFVVAVSLMLALGVRPGTALLASAGAALLIHQAFVTLFRVPLPWGLVPPFSW